MNESRHYIEMNITLLESDDLMKELQSVEEIISEFNLNSEKDNLDAIVEELTQKRIARHPDKHGGEFESQEQEDQYIRLSEAIHFVRGFKGKALAVLPESQMTSIIEALAKKLAVTQQTAQQTEQQRKQATTNAKTVFVQEISLVLRIPRISAASIATASGAIFAFWGNIQSNAVFATVQDYSDARLLWAYVCIGSVALFVATYFYEQLSRSYLDLLLGESGTYLIMKHLIDMNSDQEYHEDGEGNIRFSKRELIQVIQTPRLFNERNSFLSFLGNLTENAATECAEVILTKLEKRGIKKIDQPNIDEYYMLPQSVVEPIIRAKINQQNIRVSPTLLLFTLFLLVVLLVSVFYMLSTITSVEKNRVISLTGTADSDYAQLMIYATYVKYDIATAIEDIQATWASVDATSTSIQGTTVYLMQINKTPTASP